MNEDRRRTVLLIGAIAGAAGLAIGAWFFARRRANGSDEDLDKTVSDVLSDCYSKMREIQSHLADLAPALGGALPESA